MFEESIIRINGRGQIVLPAKIRKRLGLEAGGRLQVQLLEDGTIKIEPVTIMPTTNYLEIHPEIREEVLESFKQAREGKVFDQEATLQFIENSRKELS